MKSVSIKDKDGNLLIHIIKRKNGIYDCKKHVSVKGLIIEVRNENSEKVSWVGK